MNDPAISVAHFRGLIEETVAQMEVLCVSWEKKLSIGTHSDENICGQIRSVVGQARILTNERGRLTQFKNLVDNCERGLGEKEITLLDLQGFWEMVYVQITGILDKFRYLESVERGEEQFGENSDQLEPNASTVAKKISSQCVSRRPKLTKAVSTRDLKAFKSARKREMAQRNSQKNLLDISAPSIQSSTEKKKKDGPTSSSFKSFQGGFFNIKSPMRPKSPPESPKQRRQRFDSSKSNEFLRQAVLSTSSKQHPRSPFMVMKVSSLGKKELGVSDVKQRLFADDN